MFTDDSLDLLRRDIAAAADYDFFFPSGEPIESIGIANCKVAGMKPAILKGCAGGIRILPVTRHQLWAPNTDFTLHSGARVCTVCVRQAELDSFSRLSD